MAIEWMQDKWTCKRFLVKKLMHVALIMPMYLMPSINTSNGSREVEGVGRRGWETEWLSTINPEMLGNKGAEELGIESLVE
jgi:hypothetical protein